MKSAYSTTAVDWAVKFLRNLLNNLTKLLIISYWKGGPRRIAVNVLDLEIVASEFELHSRYMFIFGRIIIIMSCR